MDAEECAADADPRVVVAATTDFTCVRSFWGTFVTRFFVFCCSLVRLLAPRTVACVVVVRDDVAEEVAEGDLAPEVGFLVTLSDEEALSGFASELELGTEDAEGLGESFFGRKTTRGFILRDEIVEIVGTFSELLLCNTSALGRGLDLSFPERMVLRTGSDSSKKRA